MFDYIAALTPTEAEGVRRTIQDLFRQTYLLQVKINPETMEQSNNPKYEICMRNREFIADYLEVLGCELIHDPMTRVFRLAGENMPVEHMNLITTKLVIILRKIYGDKIMGEGLNASLTNLMEIREYGANTNLIIDKLTKQEWISAVNTMKIHQLIEIPGAVANIDDTTPIYINSVITLFCSTADIAELVTKYQMDSATISDDASMTEEAMLMLENDDAEMEEE